MEPMDLPERVAVLPRMPMKRQLKQLPMEQCRECYVLCDSSKFDNISSVTFADFYRSTIITDRIPSGYEDCANIIEVQKEQK